MYHSIADYPPVSLLSFSLRANLLDAQKLRLISNDDAAVGRQRRRMLVLTSRPRDDDKQINHLSQIHSSRSQRVQKLCCHMIKGLVGLKTLFPSCALCLRLQSGETSYTLLSEKKKRRESSAAGAGLRAAADKEGGKVRAWHTTNKNVAVAAGGLLVVVLLLWISALSCFVHVFLLICAIFLHLVLPFFLSFFFLSLQGDCIVSQPGLSRLL